MVGLIHVIKVEPKPGLEEVGLDCLMLNNIGWFKDALNETYPKQPRMIYDFMI